VEEEDLKHVVPWYISVSEQSSRSVQQSLIYCEPFLAVGETRRCMLNIWQGSDKVEMPGAERGQERKKTSRCYFNSTCINWTRRIALWSKAEDDTNINKARWRRLLRGYISGERHSKMKSKIAASGPEGRKTSRLESARSLVA
jgi:hypothetical protein